MKKLLTIFLLAMIAFGSLQAQTLRRVGFFSSTSPLSGIDYKTLQAAHDAASAGDTIQIYPLADGSNGASYNATFNKKLILIGPGYMYNTYNISTSEIPNAGLQTLQGGIAGISVVLAVGSNGSSFAGLNRLNITLANGVTDSINNISITRCRDLSVSLSQNVNPLNNWFISQCYGLYIYQDALSNASFSGNRTLTNWRIENCIGGNGISGNITLSSSPLGISSLQILNCNLMSAGVSGYGLFLANQSAVVQNCIIESTANYTGLANTVFINNITNTAQLNNPMFTNPGSSGNVFGVNIGGTGNVVFVGYPNNQSGSTVVNSPDARYKLTATGNPAKNGGLIPGTATQTDCGAYGGSNPYKDSGIPPVPAFYRFNSASGTASGTSYPVTFSVRSNN